MSETEVLEKKATPTTSPMAAIVKKQRDFFNTHATKPLEFRVKQLKRLKDAMLAYEGKLIESLNKDLRKSEMEAWSTEIGVTVAEIDHYVKNLGRWMKPERKKTPLFFQPGSSRLYREPFGVSLVIAPWNFPVKNLIGPVLGAMSAGNTVIMKPSEISPYTSAVIKQMIDEYFSPEYMVVVEGGVPETTELLNQRFDYVFFTGGTEIGRIVYQAAAKHLTPCTLELGGKCPTIVDTNINLDITAKRIIWGKMLNAGQACVSVDHVFANSKIKDKLIERIKHYLKEFYGDDPFQSTDISSIISDKHFNRITNIIEGDVIHGGKSDPERRFIEPTIIDNVTPDHKVMQQEIFGPILPIITYDNLDDVIHQINSGEKPLALYIFSNTKSIQDKIINETSSGGVCINEITMHMATTELPFGGVGYSGGMGSYNGWYGFDTFSHKRGVMKKAFFGDVKQKYPPYNTSKLNFIKGAAKWLLG